MSAYQHITMDREGAIATITIKRPHVLNALHHDAHFELSDAFDGFADDRELRVAVVTGTGERAFCVGSDLKARERAGGDRFPETGFAGLTTRFDLKKPVIAAVNGDAIGGGLEIVLASDLAVAVKSARFGLPEPRVGLAAAGGLHRLIRQVPEKQAMQIALTGELFSAEMAMRFGLINCVVDRSNLLPTVRKLADAIVEGAPLSIEATKRMMVDGLKAPTLEAAFAGHYPAYELMLKSGDAVEGSRAFAEKRKPVWQGR